MFKKLTRFLVISHAFKIRETIQFKKLRRYEKELDEWILNKSKIISKASIENFAYILAEKNGFSGNSEFYWNLAEGQLMEQKKKMEDLIAQYQLLISDKKAYIRYMSKKNRIIELNNCIE